MLELVFGTGLVLLVTPLVKDAMLPTAPADMAVTVLVTDAAASEPGSLGRVIVFDFPPDGALGAPPREIVPPAALPADADVRLMVGSARHHQYGM